MEGNKLAARIAAGAALVALLAGCKGGDTTIINYGPTPGTGSAAGQPNTPDGGIPSLPEVCPPAEQVSTWPQESNGSFHNPEVDGTQPGTFVEAEMWGPWAPHDTEIWVDMRHSDGTPVRAIFKNSGGTAWQYFGCDMGYINQDLTQSQQRRESELAGDGQHIRVQRMDYDAFQREFPGVAQTLVGVSSVSESGLLDISSMDLLASQLSETRVRRAAKGETSAVAL